MGGLGQRQYCILVLNARKKYQSEGERSEPELREYEVRILR